MKNLIINNLNKDFVKLIEVMKSKDLPFTNGMSKIADNLEESKKASLSLSGMMKKMMKKGKGSETEIIADALVDSGVVSNESNYGLNQIVSKSLVLKGVSIKKRFDALFDALTNNNHTFENPFVDYQLYECVADSKDAQIIHIKGASNYLLAKKEGELVCIVMSQTKAKNIFEKNEAFFDKIDNYAEYQDKGYLFKIEMSKEILLNTNIMRLDSVEFMLESMLHCLKSEDQ